jgi:PAS domain S-box-containing protein
MNHSRSERQVNSKDRRYLSFIPVPTLVVIILVLHFVVKPSLFYEPPWLLPIMNTLFITVVFLLVAYLAKRTYMATGRIQFLLLGCGVLAFGIGGVVAGFVRSIPGAGANLNVTIYNTFALIGAVFHFAAALILLTGISPEVGSKRKAFWLVLSCGGLTLFMALFTMESLEGILPLFFVQGVGPTALRQWVLGSADLLFVFSFVIFMRLFLRNREVFLYWYSSALALTSISLTAFFIESSVGSPIGWAGRVSQYLGGTYFLVAVITAMRSAQSRRTSLGDVLIASLSPVEEKFRALAEHSPDMIERFDREMKHIYVNQAGLRLYGKPAGAILGKTVGQVGVPGSYVSLLEKTIQTVFETAQPLEVEYFVPTEPRTRFYQSHCVPEFGVEGAVANVLVVSRDLTERKQTEEALREAHERAIWLARFPEENPNPVVRASVDGVVLYHNPAASTLPGWICKTGRPLQKELLPLIDRAIAEKDEIQQDVQLGGRVYIIWVAPFPDEGYVNIYGRDITKRKQAEEALQQRTAELQHLTESLERRVQERTERLEKANEALRQLSFKLLSVQEDERKRIAGELHDSVAASFGAIIFSIEKILGQVGKDEKIRVSLQELIARVQQINVETRRIMADLRPSLLDDLGIAPAITWFCREYEKIYSHIRLEKEIDLSEINLTDSLKTAVFRLCQEALNNIAKHSQATVVSLSLKERDGRIELIIQDNGQGFDPDTVRRGLGLSTMRERAELSGGSFDLHSTIGKGTLICVSWPR